MEASEVIGTEEQGAAQGYDAEPDMSEAEASMAARLGAALNDSEVDPGEEHFEEEVPQEETGWDELGGEEDGYDDEAEMLPADGTIQDPRVDQVLDYLDAREKADSDAWLNGWAEANPDLKKPAVLNAVLEQVDEMARRAGDLELRTDPKFLEMALSSVRAERAAQHEVPAEQARSQGASLETDAGASNQADESYEDSERRRIRESGPKPSAFR
jgi:hypothetical protein